MNSSGIHPGISSRNLSVDIQKKKSWEDFVRNSSEDLIKKLLGFFFFEFIQRFSSEISLEICNRNFYGDLLQEFIREFLPRIPPGVSRIPTEVFPKNYSGIFSGIFPWTSNDSSGDILQELLRRFSPEIIPGFSSRNSSKNCSGDNLQKFYREFSSGIPPEIFCPRISSRISPNNSSGNFHQEFVKGLPK